MQTMRLIPVLIVVLWAGVARAGLRWETDFEEAKQTAAATHRYLLLDFSGSDWCGWCVKLDQEVFSQKEFRDYAEDNLTCVLVDFPRTKTLRKSLKEQNDQLAQTYGVRGYPTVIVLAPDGTTVVQTGYRAGGAASYVTYLSGVVAGHRAQHKVPAPAPADSTAARGATARPALRPAASDLPSDTTREVRAWTSKRGSSVTAFLLMEKGPYVILRQEDGKDVQVAKSSLSPVDQDYITTLKTVARADQD